MKNVVVVNEYVHVIVSMILMIKAVKMIGHLKKVKIVIHNYVVTIL